MKRVNQIIWGIIFIGVGVLLCLNIFDILSFSLFFEGWWTLLIIIPAAVSLITGNDKTGSLIWLAVGVLLLLFCRDIIRFEMIWKLALPIIIVLIGIKMLVGNRASRAGEVIVQRIKNTDGKISNGNAIFSGENMNLDGEVFEGAELNAVFGALKCDLRGAVINDDCVIKASAVFGGIDIIAPDGVRVVVSSNSVFGGVSNKHKAPEAAEGVQVHTLYVNGSALFGGVEVK